jgi:hypothetical protein
MYKLLIQGNNGKLLEVAAGTWKFVTAQASVWVGRYKVFIKSDSGKSRHLYECRVKHHMQRNYRDDMVSMRQIY